MPPLSLDDFHDLYTIKGGGSPVPDQAAGGRDLTLGGSGTAPRASSYRRRRGAEFRSATFAATAPRYFASDSPGSALHTALYVANKVQSFTYWGWCKPQKGGVTSEALTPLGGLFSASNMGATPWIYDQPCLILTSGAAGAGYVVVSIMGSILDTRTATQTVGPATTTPLADGENAFVAVRVTGSSSTNNQIDAVALYVRTQDGVVRVYTLGAHASAVKITYGATAPSNNQTLTIDGRVRTWKTTLTGTPATGEITYGGSGNATDGETFVVGDITYTLRDYVGAGRRPTTVFEFNTSVGYGASTPKTRFSAGGWNVTCLWGTKYPDGSNAGSLGFGAHSADISVAAAAKVFDAWQGGHDGLRDFTQPSPPATGQYDAGRGWADRRVVPGTDATTSIVSGSYPREIPLCGSSVGAAAIAVMVWEQTLATGAWDKPCTPCRLGRNSPFIARVKAYSTDVIGGASGAAGNVGNGTYFYTCTFVDSAGRESVEQGPSSGITVSGGAKHVGLTGIPLGPTGTVSRKVYRTKASGGTATSPYFLLTTINDNTTTTFDDNTADASLPATGLPTTIYMVGGAASAAANAVKIGATWADTKANIIAAINGSGTPGTEYSAGTSANAKASASASGDNVALTSLLTGSAGNGITLSESISCVSGVTAFSGGGAATNDEVLIGASSQTAWDNMAAAINKTGSVGVQYGSDGTLVVDPTVTAEAGTLFVKLTAKASGAAGNGKAVSTTATGATITDEFGDKTLTSTYGGQSAPPFTVAAGARPDNADLRIVVGGFVG